jgi:hypothetical protein
MDERFCILRKAKMNWAWIIPAAILFLWLAVEIVMRSLPYPRGFYGSLPSEFLPQKQRSVGVKVIKGHNWFHLGWIADPDFEYYRVEKWFGDGWDEVARTNFGSYMTYEESGRYRVIAVHKGKGQTRMIGMADVKIGGEEPEVRIPTISGEWQTLFRPRKSGRYINDHVVYQSADGNWCLIGITSQTDGDFSAERFFATAISPDFPPKDEMQEAELVADFGELAWAPDVFNHEGMYHLYWSPHKLHHMTSQDGIHWKDHRVILKKPFHKYFRDATVIQVAEDQWLLYATARGRFFSQIDIYQSFDLENWQYIRPALRSDYGSERNSAYASLESPQVVRLDGRYYLSTTYNNGTTFVSGLLLKLKKWLRPTTYNDTLVFHSSNPYDFGIYRGKRHSRNLLTTLKTHAPCWIHVPEEDKWFITTAGWPWAATLTSGEVAFAPLEWKSTGSYHGEDK